MTDDDIRRLIEEFTYERWGTFEVGATPEERARCRYLRTAAILMAAILRGDVD